MKLDYILLSPPFVWPFHHPPFFLKENPPIDQFALLVFFSYSNLVLQNNILQNYDIEYKLSIIEYYFKLPFFQISLHSFS